jgi:hypothetical protein
MGAFALRRKFAIERLEDRLALAADFNEDATVDEFDLRSWQAGYSEVQAAPTQGDADSDGDVDGRDFLEWQRQFGPQQNNLIAYRPQSVQDPNDPVDGAIYDRPTTGGYPGGFPKRPVREQDETSNFIGPGIRINWDDDNNSGVDDVNESGGNGIDLENDLIEVKVERLPGQGDLVLSFGSRLALFYDYDKETPIPSTGSTTQPLQFDGNDSVTIFVEYTNATHGTDTVSLVDQATSTTLDSLRFHSFRSLVVVFGGRGQDPQDTDKDGSIGDPDPDPDGGAGNREGIFDLAQGLYESGWDVMAFDSRSSMIFDNVVGVAEAEIKNAWDRRFINPNNPNPSLNGSGFAILGYSWGGGVTNDLIEELFADGYTTIYGLYLDAVEWGFIPNPTEENDWPNETIFLLNIWQPNGVGELGGGPISNPEEVPPFSQLEQFEFTAEDHYSIDDEPEVHDLIVGSLDFVMIR